MTLVTEMLSLARSLTAAQESEAGTTRNVFGAASTPSAVASTGDPLQIDQARLFHVGAYPLRKSQVFTLDGRRWSAF